MSRLLLAIALTLTLGAAAEATSPCANGQCRKPVRNAIAAVPTLAAPRRPHPIVVKPSEGQRSVVVRRGFRRGPGLWARITFRPGR
jgi:hypothetical protein